MTEEIILTYQMQKRSVFEDLNLVRRMVRIDKDCFSSVQWLWHRLWYRGQTKWECFISFIPISFLFTVLLPVEFLPKLRYAAQLHKKSMCIKFRFENLITKR